MPPRGIVFAIVVFWLAMTAVLINEEIVPRWRARTAPPYTIEVTDEAGSPQVEWTVLFDERPVGRGLTAVRRQPDRTFEMSQKFRFDDLELPAFVGRLTVRKLDTRYRVTRAGRLLGLHVSGEASLKGNFGSFDLNAVLEGEVEDGRLAPRLTAFGQTIDLGLEPIAVDEHGSVLNPMHLLHRLPNLQPGQRWSVPLFDPFKMFSAKQILGQQLPKFASSPKVLEAEVTADEMTWNRERVECLRIGYREPAREEIAQTWVRRDNGLVLEQVARQPGGMIRIRRVP